MTNDAGVAGKIAGDLDGHENQSAWIEVVEGGFRVEGRCDLHRRWSVLPPAMEPKSYEGSWNVVSVDGRSGKKYPVVVYAGF